MKVTVYNLKGGVGKTRIAANIAMTLDWGIVTNDDYSPLNIVMADNKMVKIEQGESMPVFPEEYDIVFDLGGYPDERAISAIHQSDCVLIPTCNAADEIEITLHTIAEVRNHCKKLAVIANRIVGNDFDVIQEAVRSVIDIPIFPMKSTKALTNLFKNKKSVHQLVEMGGINAYQYKNAKKQLDEIFKFIMEE